MVQCARVKVEFLKVREMGGSLQLCALVKRHRFREGEHEFFEVSAPAQN